MFDLQDQLSVEDVQADERRHLEGTVGWDLSETSALKAEHYRMDKNSGAQSSVSALSVQEKDQDLMLLQTKLSKKINEVQVHIKSQDLMLSKEIDEVKHMEQDLQRTEDKNLFLITCLNQELNHVQIKMKEERQLASQTQQGLGAQVSEAQALIESHDLLLSQLVEEHKQTKQDLQRVQSLFTSTEKELNSEREKSIDLERQNRLLGEEKLKLCAELNQVQTKLVQMEESVQTQAAECERHQQKIRELELQVKDNSTNRATTFSVEGVVSGESSSLEREVRDLSDTLSAPIALRLTDQINTVMETIEKLWEEKRELLHKLSEAEEMGSKGMMAKA
ncbi:X-linked retinitis pigmentosa GTPase regulator-interacting protein 1-like [Anabas testudineus]|uniref:X-linked retinitis pigmentosa GTPase regulator-interacting protein 1-like n=1 Tax=Anabas testudineus TaxID=64144 RepID=UPI000E464CC1|nr:X-linked retinitis pigmentosa GTPase regulator-interacting protein 1-like [Anabas testudineus]